MGITAFIGQQGRGKTFYMLWRALHHAMKYGKRLVTNFPVDIEFLEKFAIANNLRNLHSMIKSGDILFIPENVEYLLSIPDSCVLLDEAAIFLGDAIQGSKVSYLISRFNQCRKRHIELFYTGQAYSRIPKILRDITTAVIFCNGICTRDLSGTPVLYKAQYLFFDPDEFETWFASSKKSNWLYTKNHSYKQHSFILNSYYAMFFSAYDSFVDVIADSKPSGYRHYRIIPKNSKCKITVSEPIPKISKPIKLKSRSFPSWFVAFVKPFISLRVYKTNDYIRFTKWNTILHNRPKFSPDDPFKLRWLESTTPVSCYQSVSVLGFPTIIPAHFLIAWWLSHYLPAPLLPLCGYFYGPSFNFPVSVDSHLCKFPKLNF